MSFIDVLFHSILNLLYLLLTTTDFFHSTQRYSLVYTHSYTLKIGNLGWQSGSSGRIPAYQSLGFEFKPQYHQIIPILLWEQKK
jgi:hypothetical protein